MPQRIWNEGLTNAMSLAESIAAKMACHAPSNVVDQVEVGAQCSLPLADKSVECCFKAWSLSRSMQTMETVEQLSTSSGLTNAMSLAESITAKMACHTPSKVEVGTQSSLPLADKSVGCSFEAGSLSRSMQTMETVEQLSTSSGQRRLRKPNMATAQCSIDVFEQLDDAARVEAYRTAVSEAGALKTEVDQLRRELEGLKIMFSNGHDSVKEVDAPKPPLDPQLQASHDFFCNLLAPIVERIERLESKTREDSDAESCQSTETSAASINLQRGSGNQRGKAKDEATLCISNSSGEDARNRLSSFAASSLPHLGKDVTAWFHQVDFWFRTFSVHEEVAIPFIISRLPAKDFTWMRHHAKMVNIATWADVKAAFRRRYNIDCDVTSKQRMFGATQRAGESCTDFAYRKLDLMEQCNYPVLQKEKCQVIMATLSDKAKKHFFDKNFEELNDMIDSFLRFDQISNTEENVKVLVAVEPPTSQTTERPVLVKRSSRKSMRNRQRKESMESSGLRNAMSLAESITAKRACYTPSKVVGHVEIGTKCSLPLADKSVGCSLKARSVSRSMQTTETVEQLSTSSGGQ
ncbi:hypothetical protein HPB49_014051 [Dermacentor silvarum]|uniref:Uncharacterized protein n=1 Tax=Dermacentor silvarum TaxID=543639 RepID=A0ACB8CRQ0_DERSI|nr:hypothetical protein HPB49_014051 [Dermacentor silvarum]